MSDLSDLEELETDFKARGGRRTQKQIKHDIARINASNKRQIATKRKFGQLRKRPISLAPIFVPDEEI